MSNVWLTQQYFEKSYGDWISALKGQHLEKIFVGDTDIYYDSPDYDYEIPADVDESGFVLMLRNGRSFHIIPNGSNMVMLSDDNTDTTKTIRVEDFLDSDDEDGLFERPIWQPLDGFHAVDILDVAPSVDWDEKVDGIILIFPCGNLCIKYDGFFETDVESPRYIKRIESRKMFAIMTPWLSQFAEYRADEVYHRNGRNPDEQFVFEKLAHREDISSLFGRNKLGYSHNCLPSRQETCSILCELTLIFGAASPEKVFDAFNWFCKERCNKYSNCDDCVISPYCNKTSPMELLNQM